jgi:hypothetical protein
MQSKCSLCSKMALSSGPGNVVVASPRSRMYPCSVGRTCVNSVDGALWFQFTAFICYDGNNFVDCASLFATMSGRSSTVLQLCRGGESAGVLIQTQIVGWNGPKHCGRRDWIEHFERQSFVRPTGVRQFMVVGVLALEGHSTATSMRRNFGPLKSSESQLFEA